MKKNEVKIQEEPTMKQKIIKKLIIEGQVRRYT